jgi:hypothetical protein
MSGARRRRKHPLPAVVVLPLGKLGQYVGRITATAISQASQLVSVAPLARQLNELVDGITAAVIGKTAQLIHVTPLARQLDELVNGVSVTGRGARPQVQQILISHARTLHPGSAPTTLAARTTTADRPPQGHQQT